MEEGKSDKRSSINAKLIWLITVTIVTLSIVFIAAAYYITRKNINDDYANRTAAADGMVQSMISVDDLLPLYDFFASDTYMQIYDKAVAEDNPELIADALREAGLYDTYMSIADTLHIIYQENNLADLYIFSMRGHDCDSIVVAEGISLRTGTKMQSEFSYEGNGEGVFEGFFSYSYDNVWYGNQSLLLMEQSSDRALIVSSEVLMTDIITEQRNFLLEMAGFAMVFLLISLAAATRLMTMIATKPIVELSRVATSFADGEVKQLTKEDVIDLEAPSNDEIGDLYHDFKVMQERMIDYADNLAEIRAEQEKLGAELSIAARIQAEMLPRVQAPFAGHQDFALYASMNPAKEVGGDFYDFFFVDPDHLALVMADVSGKGVPAAMFMARSMTMIKTRTMAGGSPAEIMADVNNALNENNDANYFVTVYLAIIELSTGRGISCNAGHEHPAYCPAGGKFDLVRYDHDPAVGMMDGLVYENREFVMHHGDKLFLYTDGVPEANQVDNDLFGYDRMLKALNEDPMDEGDKLLSRVSDSIAAFIGDAPQFDDTTMLAFYYR